MAPTTILLILFLVGGALLIGISIPLIQRRIRPNHWYGFRVRQTLEDPRVWYPVNSYSGRWLFGVGVAEIVVAAVLYYLPNIDVALYGAIVGGIVIAGLTFGFALSMRYLHRLTKSSEA